MKTFATGRSIPQTVPPRSPRETLPDMYDLPSEDVGEPGLPDEFHDLQPQLLSRTLILKHYANNEWFTGADLHLYYDVHHPLWYKRPDWFLAVGVPRLYDGHDLRRSYVTWQEGNNPHVVIEFLSPGTEREDLGRFYRADETLEVSTESESLAAIAPDPTSSSPATDGQKPPPKFTVYEQSLRIPHYLVYHRPTQKLRYFQLMGGQYQEQPVLDSNPKVWLADLEIGLGLWQGTFEGIPGYWLRWCQADGTWLLTDTEQAQVQVLQGARSLLATGMSIDQVAELLRLSADQIQQL